MSRKRRTSTEVEGFEQLALPLDQLLEEHLGDFVPLPFTEKDLGGNVLGILSKGLYSDPLDCLREYLQNAVDAGARQATIKVTGNSIHIFDDGGGMSLDGIVQSRQFGLSPKDPETDVGFRGIGLYSSYSLCDHLQITSKHSGDLRPHILLIEFGKIKAILDSEAHKPPREQTPLTELLSAHTMIGRGKDVMTSELSFTHVEMQGISPDFSRKIGNREELRRYLVRTLPIDFADTFPYREQINRQLELEVPGYRAVKVVIQYDGEDDVVISKPDIPHLQAPTMGHIIAGTGKDARKVAYYWACMNKERGQIGTNAKFVPAVANCANRTERQELERKYSDEFSEYEGFVYKVKGFTVGTRDRLRSTFEPKPQLYPWYTGEIWVLDTRVVPKADRADFEAGEYKDLLDSAVLEELSTLEEAVEKYRDTSVANERVDLHSAAIVRIQEAYSNQPKFDPYAALNDLHSIKKDLSRQKSKASSGKKSEAQALLRKIEQLQLELQARLASRPDEADQGTFAGQSGGGEGMDTGAREQNATRNGRLDENGADGARAPLAKSANVRVSAETPAPTSLLDSTAAGATISRVRRLQDVLADAGWAIDGDTGRLLQVLQKSLESVLRDRSLYDSVLADFEERLNDDFALPDGDEFSAEG